VTVYTFQPNFYQGPNLFGKFLELARDPIGTFVGDAAQHHDQAKTNAGVFPVQVDDEYDTVTVVLPGPQVGKLFGIGKPANLENAASAQAALQATYDAGVVVPGIPRGYQQFADEIAALGQSHLARPPPQAQSPDVITLPRSDMGQNFMGGFIPPGGVAGFNQMTPSSQLALTRGARGTRTRSKRRKTRTKRTKTRKARKTRTKRGKAKRFVKGSAAAKRYMAKIRRKRK
jgi:hypothetical protein